MIEGSGSGSILWLVDPDPEGPKTCGSGGSGSATLPFSRHFRRGGFPPNIFHICSIAISTGTYPLFISSLFIVLVTAFRHCFMSPPIITAFRHCSVQWPVLQVLHGSLECLLVCFLLYRVWQLIPKLHYSHRKRIFSYVCPCIVNCVSKRCCGP